MYKTEAIGKASKEAPFEKISIGREGTSEDDVEVDIKYCGYCHTDIHLVNNDWGFTTFPCVGGHEVNKSFTSSIPWVLQYVQKILLHRKTFLQ